MVRALSSWRLPRSISAQQTFLSLALILGVCDTHISDGAVLSIKVNMHFTSIYLVTGCCHGAQGEEASSEQGVSIETSEVRTAKPDPSSRKAQPGDMCGPLSRDLLPLPEHDRMYPDEGLYVCGADLFQHQKEIRDKLCRRAEGQPSFVTNSSVHTGERTLTCSRDGKPFLGSTGLLQQLAPRGVGQPHGDTECQEAFGHEQSGYRCTQCGKAFSRKQILVEHQKIRTGIQLYEHSKCGKCFKDKAYFIKYQRVHTGESPYE